MAPPTNPAATEADVAQLHAWNWHPETNSYAPAEVEALIHDKIQEQAICRPEAQAVCAWDGRLTYRALEDVSARLARQLRGTYGLGTPAGADAFVPLCFEKSKWNVVAMLAVLKAGGAFVPMDPKHPPQRMRTLVNLLGDHFAGFVLSSSSLAGRLASDLGLAVVTVDDALLDYQTHDDDADNTPLGEVAPTTAALAIFTSGSTGTPKGIVQEHRTYCSAARYHGAGIGFRPDWRVLQFAAHTFYVSLSDILTTLIHGGCVCIPSEDQRLNDLAGAIRTLKANSLHLTPTVARMLDPADPALQSVTTMSLGGEPLCPQVLGLWAGNDRINVVQGYGPAECGVDCAARQHMAADDAPNDVGRPCGCSIWIVDPADHDVLLPIGAEGELLVEGPVVAPRGYLNDPPQTVWSFIFDPKWVAQTRVKHGRRFYKTGDLGRYTPDGSIVVLGRNDGQVKLRGQRLEIGEVEQQLSSILGGRISVAVAVATPRGAGDKVLAAFIDVGSATSNNKNNDDEDDDDPRQQQQQLVAYQEELVGLREALEEPDVGHVKAQLRQKLPSYMVPSVFIPLRRMPLSPSGKIDRRLLVQLVEGMTQQELARQTASLTSSSSDDGNSSPSGSSNSRVIEIYCSSPEKEAAMARAWKDVLGLEQQVGPRDNFFHLGGDSAKSMLLVSTLRRAGFTLTVADIIAHPVLSHQAALLAPRVDLAPVTPFSLLPAPAHVRLRSLAAAACGLDEDKIVDVYPLTEMQARFFAGSYYDAGPPLTADFHMREMVFEIPQDARAGFDVERWLEAWRAAGRRHAALRTRFVEDEMAGRVIQAVVDEQVDIPTSVVEGLTLHDVVGKARPEVVFFGAPNVRVTVGRQRHDDGRLLPVWCVVHISHGIYDGGMLGAVFTEVRRTYHEGASFVPSRPSIQMSNLLSHIASQDRAAALAFWREDLKDADAKSLIPADLPNAHTIQNVVHKKTVRLEGTLPPDSPSRATLIQVSAALLLACTLGCADVVFDCHGSGRSGPLPGVGDLVGPAVNSLPIRVRVGRDPAGLVMRILRDTQSHMARVVAHEHVGWWDLLHHTAPTDDLYKTLRTAPLLNVLPRGGGALNAALGLLHRRTVAVNRGAHGLMGLIEDAHTIELLVFGNRDCVPAEDLREQLDQFETVLRRVWECCWAGDDGLTVGDVSVLLGVSTPAPVVSDATEQQKKKRRRRRSWSDCLPCVAF